MLDQTFTTSRKRCILMSYDTHTWLQSMKLEWNYRYNYHTDHFLNIQHVLDTITYQSELSSIRQGYMSNEETLEGKMHTL